MDVSRCKSLLFSSVKLLIACHIYRSCAVSSTMMRSVTQKKFGDAKELYIASDCPVPKLQPNEVLIRVHASAINRADLLLREGKYPGLKNVAKLGLEASGVIEAVGTDTAKWEIGEKVMALVNGGGYAEYVAVNENHVMPIPQQLNFNEAAAIPEAWLTAYQLLHFIGNVQEDETVLIHGGGSGVGTAAIQLVKFAGARSIVTAGNETKINFAKKLGAFEGFNYKEGEFQGKVMNATDGKGVDLILDCVGGSYWKQNAECLAMEGRWVVYGLLGGAMVDGPLLSYVLRKRASITGTTLKSRSDAYKARLISDFTSNALPHFKEGRLHPIIDKLYSMNAVADAHEYMSSNKNNGKIVLIVREEAKDEL